jgi:hypothetical protein
MSVLFAMKPKPSEPFSGVFRSFCCVGVFSVVPGCTSDLNITSDQYDPQLRFKLYYMLVRCLLREIFELP